MLGGLLGQVRRIHPLLDGGPRSLLGIRPQATGRQDPTEQVIYFIDVNRADAEEGLLHLQTVPRRLEMTTTPVLGSLDPIGHNHSTYHHTGTKKNMVLSFTFYNDGPNFDTALFASRWFEARSTSSSNNVVSPVVFIFGENYNRSMQWQILKVTNDYTNFQIRKARAGEELNRTGLQRVVGSVSRFAHNIPNFPRFGRNTGDPYENIPENLSFYPANCIVRLEMSLVAPSDFSADDAYHNSPFDSREQE